MGCVGRGDRTPGAVAVWLAPAAKAKEVTQNASSLPVVLPLYHVPHLS